jgi:uncharacterized membrane protein YsdA (DUF1294 family)
MQFVFLGQRIFVLFQFIDYGREIMEDDTNVGLSIRFINLYKFEGSDYTILCLLLAYNIINMVQFALALAPKYREERKKNRIKRKNIIQVVLGLCSLVLYMVFFVYTIKTPRWGVWQFRSADDMNNNLWVFWLRFELVAMPLTCLYFAFISCLYIKIRKGNKLMENRASD